MGNELNLMEINNNNPSLFQMAKPDTALNFWLNQWTPELFIVMVATPILNFFKSNRYGQYHFDLRLRPFNRQVEIILKDQTYFIELDQGRIHGSILDNDVLFFEGVPYALPPRGFYGRWRPPRKINNFAELNRDDNYQQKKSCPQYYWDIVESHSTEDCLFLDITR